MGDVLFWMDVVACGSLHLLHTIGSRHKEFDCVSQHSPLAAFCDRVCLGADHFLSGDEELREAGREPRIDGGRHGKLNINEKYAVQALQSDPSVVMKALKHQKAFDRRRTSPLAETLLRVQRLL